MASTVINNSTVRQACCVDMFCCAFLVCNAQVVLSIDGCSVCMCVRLSVVVGSGSATSSKRNKIMEAHYIQGYAVA